MSSDPPGPRPRQVTIGGWLAAVSSAVLVVSVFDAMTQLHSIDTRDRLTRALVGWPSGLGISLGDALSLTRGALFVSGVAAVVTGILGIFVLQRHATARIVLTLAAVPVVVTAPVAGGFVGLLIGGAAVMLWTPEARDWFAGRAPAKRVADRPALLSPMRPAAPPRPSSSAWPQAPARTSQDLAGPSAYRVPARPRASRLPREVRIACVLTWIFSALTGGVYFVVLVAVAADRGRVLELARDNPTVRNTSLSDSQVIGVVVAVSAVVIAWCILAALFAVLTSRGHRGGWVLLLGSVGVASCVEVLALPYSFVHVAACITTVVLLLRPRAREWLQRDGAPPAPSAVQSWPPPEQQPGATERPPGKPPVW
ncbi:hypothetical protein ACVW00_003822 [Marmoricola sp. URHA0025 HA25]